MPKDEPLDLVRIASLWQDLCEHVSSCAKLIQSVDEDVETVHQYRIAIRKARSLFVFLKPLLKAAFFKQVNDQLRTNAKLFSKVREWDVLLEYYRNDYLAHVAEDSILTARLLDEQRKHRADAYAKFALIDISTVKRSNEFDLSEMGFKRKASQNASSAFVEKRIKTLNKKIADLERKSHQSDFKNVHATRIAYKRLRYALEALNPMFENGFDKRIKRVKAKTNQLGKRCDRYTMLENLKSLLNKTDASTLALEAFMTFIASEMTMCEKHAGEKRTRFVKLNAKRSEDNA